MNIAICDDNEKEIAFLKYTLEKNFTECKITVFLDGASLINHVVDNTTDIVLLDIEMPGINGLETAIRIREKCTYIGLIFVTAHAQYALDSFGVYPFDFLVKPVNSNRLINSVNLLANKSLRPKEAYVVFNARGTVFRIDQKDIIFIEKCNHRCMIYTEQFVYDTRALLSYFEKRLESDDFVKTHKGFIVNKTKIAKLTSRGNLAYTIQFYGTEKTALLSRGMNEKLHLSNME